MILGLPLQHQVALLQVTYATYWMGTLRPNLLAGEGRPAFLPLQSVTGRRRGKALARKLGLRFRPHRCLSFAV